MSTAQIIANDSRLTVDDIDDILDEIEERECKTLLAHKFDQTLELKPIQHSLDIELDMIEAQQSTTFDAHCLLNGYFIVHAVECIIRTPTHIVSRIIDLCVLYTFDESYESQSHRSSSRSGTEHMQRAVALDHELSASPLSPSPGIQGIEDDVTTSNNKTAKQRCYERYRGDEDEETSASELDEDEMCAIMVPFGHAQSPINIITKPSSPFAPQVMDQTELFVENPLRFNYPSMIKNCSIINNGHTVQINIPHSKMQCSLFIQNKLYKLRQFHFHTPSEHTVDGKQYEMEMHLVHVSEQNEIAVLGFIFSTKQAYKKPTLQLSKSRMHLVLQQKASKKATSNKKKSKNQLTVSVVKEPEQGGADESDDMETDDEEDQAVSDECKKQQQSNDFLDQFWNELPVNKTEQEIMLNGPISFDYLFETSSNNFSKNVETNEMNIDMEIFEYMGSLTTPPYTEGVQWLVSKSLHYMNEQQLEKLRSCWNHENNARPTQGYYGRSVQLRSKSSFRVLQ